MLKFLLLFLVIGCATESKDNDVKEEVVKPEVKREYDRSSYIHSFRGLSFTKKIVDEKNAQKILPQILSKKDSEKLGFNLDKLNFSQLAQTANGKILISPVVFDKVSLGFKNFSNVKAFISQTNMEKSLLGMSFLSRLKKLELGRNIMIINI